MWSEGNQIIGPSGVTFNARDHGEVKENYFEKDVREYIRNQMTRISTELTSDVHVRIL